MKKEWENCVKTGDVETTRHLLSSGSDVNARDRYGQTGLMLAAMHGKHQIVELLLANGADLNVTAKYNLSALMLAVINGHAHIARMLARAGADRAIQGKGAPGFRNQTAYDLAAARGMTDILDELRP